MAYLELDRITKRYGTATAVADLSLSVVEGEMLCLLGPSGCGKTTTLRAIAGFEHVDSGAIRLGGVDVTDIPPEKRDIGLVFQNYALFPHLSVEENVAFGLRMRKRPAAEIRATVAEALRLVQLDGVGGRLPRQLSGGQQQRVALARAIAIRPRLLLLDEPLSNLDAKLRDTMRDEIRRVQRETGLTAIFVTHDQSEALAMADRMAVMDHGRIVQVDTPARVYDNPAHPFIAGFIGQANLIEGRVVEASGGTALIEAGGLRIGGHCRAALSVGQSAMAVIKTDRSRLMRGAGVADETTVPVRVTMRTFLGPFVSFTCENATGVKLSALMPSADAQFEAGESVLLSWRVEDCLIIPGVA